MTIRLEPPACSRRCVVIVGPSSPKDTAVITMPRGKSYRRSEAVKWRMAERQLASSDAGAWASHLRSLAEGIVLMPEDCHTFGVMSTPGACTDLLRTEDENAVLPRVSDAVCVMAPSNNLTASKTPKQGGIAFGQYLATVCSVWPTAQVHPSDDMAMPILVESLLLFAATKQHLEIPAPKPQVSRPVSPKPLPKVVPRVIVVGPPPLLSGRLYSWAGRGTTLNMSMALVHHRDEWFIMWYAIFHLTMIFT
ncbi:hypothetical protein ABVT39_027276 [Epinephelus coioides]